MHYISGTSGLGFTRSVMGAESRAADRGRGDLKEHRCITTLPLNEPEVKRKGRTSCLAISTHDFSKTSSVSLSGISRLQRIMTLDAEPQNVEAYQEHFDILIPGSIFVVQGAKHRGERYNKRCEVIRGNNRILFARRERIFLITTDGEQNCQPSRSTGWHDAWNPALISFPIVPL